MAELRWILAGVGCAAIAAIWWWSTRRSGQAPGHAELRESSVMPLQGAASAGEVRERAPEIRDAAADLHERSPRTIAPLEPLSIRTSDFEPVLDLPDVGVDPRQEGSSAEEVDYIETSISDESSLDVEVPLGDIDAVADRSEPTVDHEAVYAGDDAPTLDPIVWTPPTTPSRARLSPLPPPPPSSPRPPLAAAPSQAPLNLGSGPESSDRVAAAEPSGPNAGEQQKIVALRVCAVGESRWSGRDLTSALEGHGLAYGRYQVFHRKHADGRSIFCVASLIEPGTFDAARMAEEEFRGVSLFAVLPGPVEPLQTIDALLNTARELARDLSGTVQDAKGMPFSPQRVAALREDVARFQSRLNSSARESAARGPAS